MEESFGERLRRLRIERRLSIRGLAALANFNPGNVHRFETGQNFPGYESVNRLAAALEVRPSELRGAEEELPTLRPYLRAAYGMDETAAADVERYIRRKYGDAGEGRRVE